MAKPIRTLNKRRRRAERRALCEMYMTVSTTSPIEVNGTTVVISNECWRWRTNRSYRSRRRAYETPEMRREREPVRYDCSMGGVDLGWVYGPDMIPEP